MLFRSTAPQAFRLLVILRVGLLYVAQHILAPKAAEQIEEDAKTELQKLRRQSLETIEQVRRQLEETKENYRVMLARSQQESQEMARRAGEVIGEIDRISASLGKNTTEKSKNGLRDVLNSLRPKTEEN